MFTFKVVETVNSLGSRVSKEYTGFTHLITRRNIKNNYLVVAWFDGEPDYWIVNKQIESLKQLQEYYNDMVGIIPPLVILKEAV